MHLAGQVAHREDPLVVRSAEGGGADHLSRRRCLPEPCAGDCVELVHAGAVPDVEQGLVQRGGRAGVALDARRVGGDVEGPPLRAGAQVQGVGDVLLAGHVDHAVGDPVVAGRRDGRAGAHVRVELAGRVRLEPPDPGPGPGVEGVHRVVGARPAEEHEGPAVPVLGEGRRRPRAGAGLAAGGGAVAVERPLHRAVGRRVGVDAVDRPQVTAVVEAVEAVVPEVDDEAGAVGVHGDGGGGDDAADGPGAAHRPGGAVEGVELLVPGADVHDAVHDRRGGVDARPGLLEPDAPAGHGVVGRHHARVVPDVHHPLAELRVERDHRRRGHGVARVDLPLDPEVPGVGGADRGLARHARVPGVVPERRPVVRRGGRRGARVRERDRHDHPQQRERAPRP